MCNEFPKLHNYCQDTPGFPIDLNLQLKLCHANFSVPIFLATVTVVINMFFVSILVLVLKIAFEVNNYRCNSQVNSLRGCNVGQATRMNVASFLKKYACISFGKSKQLVPFFM